MYARVCEPALRKVTLCDVMTSTTYNDNLDNKHNIKSKFPPKEPHQIVQYNKSFKLKPSMGYS